MAKHITALKPGTSRWPVDEHCSLKDTHQGHCDDKGAVYEYTLLDTSAANNHNKFHIVQLLEPFSQKGYWYLYQRHGRVGQVGSTSENCSMPPVRDEPPSAFSQVFKSKTGIEWRSRDTLRPVNDKYAHIRRDYKAQERRVEDDDEGVRDILQLICPDKDFISPTRWYTLKYDASKFPLGPMSTAARADAQVKLYRLDKLLTRHGPPYAHVSRSTLEDLSSSYHTLVPRAFTIAHGVPTINTRTLLEQEQQHLQEVRQALKAMQWTKHSTSNRPNSTTVRKVLNELGVSNIEPVQKHTSEYEALQDCCRSFRGSTHGHIVYSLEQIYRVEKFDEGLRFIAKTHELDKDSRQLLWHGSPLANFQGILREGLQIKSPEWKGNMFGRGIYFANVCSKSVQYCKTTSANSTGLLLLCEVQLGDTLVRLRSDKTGEPLIKRHKKDSISAMGQMGPSKMRDAGALLGRQELNGVLMPQGGIVQQNTGASLCYDEFVVYDPALVRIRYIFRLKVT